MSALRAMADFKARSYQRGKYVSNKAIARAGRR
jgi:hypothetical protein